MTAGPAPGRAADRVRAVFLGSGPFAVPILDALVAHPAVELVGVVTAPDRPAGRGKLLRPTPVALRARTMWVQLLQPVRLREPEAVEAVAGLRPDLAVLADYGQIVPRAVLDLPRLGVVGVHPSLLPRHRGATPIQATIRDGDAVAGVSTYLMDDGVDTGPVLFARSWPLHGTETAPELEAASARAGADVLALSITALLDRSARPIPQDVAAFDVTRPLRREQARLDPSRPAEELERTVRAHAGWPGSFIETESGRVAVLRAAVGQAAEGDEPGQLVADGAGLALATAGGRLVLEAVQPAGKQAMSGADFLNGRRELVGTKVMETSPPKKRRAAEVAS